MVYRHFRPWFGLLLVASAVAGCDYSRKVSYVAPPGVTNGVAEIGDRQAEPTPAASDSATEGPIRRPEILANVIKLIDTAALKPGGDNFRLAAANLNDYFHGTDSTEYALRPEDRTFLLKQLPEAKVRQLETPAFTLHDARHMEDCMLYSRIVARVAGTGDDLSRVRRVFEWIMREVQLVPAGSLGSVDLPQVPVRPYDALVRGMATEEQGSWAERGWLFMSFCRQLGIDVGLITYTPPKAKEPVAWICGVLIDGKIYLFDARIGLAVPGPSGEGVATLDDAMNDPAVLRRLDLPGQFPYYTTRQMLTASASRIGILIDSSPGYLSPRMRLLQGELAGKDRTILHREPAAQRDRFIEALGPRAGEVALWALPIVIESNLFTDAKFVESTKRSLAMFDPQFPLLYARMKQLRGEFAEAINDYMVGIRFNDDLMMPDQKTPVPAEERRSLNAYATYFLAISHLERDNLKQAEFFFGELLRMVPEPGPGQPYYNMLRWGAATRLAYLNRDKGDTPRAIAYFSETIPLPERHGNLLMARDLVWSNPFSSPPPPLPPAPAHEVSIPTKGPEEKP